MGLPPFLALYNQPKTTRSLHIIRQALQTIIKPSLSSFQVCFLPQVQVTWLTIARSNSHRTPCLPRRNQACLCRETQSEQNGIATFQSSRLNNFYRHISQTHRWKPKSPSKATQTMATSLSYTVNFLTTSPTPLASVWTNTHSLRTHPSCRFICSIVTEHAILPLVKVLPLLGRRSQTSMPALRDPWTS